MSTAHRIIDCWMNQSKQSNCCFAHVWHSPDECAQSLTCQSFHPQQQSERTSSAPKPTSHCSPARGPVSGAAEMRDRLRN